MGQQPPHCTQRSGEEQYSRGIAEALRKAKAHADKHPERTPLITINSWNEWTETSYLQPCNIYGYGYLEAVKSVFIDEINK